MFSGNCSLDVQKAKCIRVWPRRGGTERKSSAVPALSRAYRCPGMSVESTGRALEWGRPWREEKALPRAHTHARGEWMEPGRVPSHSRTAVFNPHRPVCVRAFLWMFQGERLPHKKNDSQQARQQMLPFNELQASELLFRGLILSHRALYTAGTWLQWVTDPWPILTFAGLIHTRPHHDFSLRRWTLGTIAQWEGLGKGHLSFCVVIKPGSVCQSFLLLHIPSEFLDTI